MMPKVIIPKEFERKRSLVAIPQKDYEAYLVMRRAHLRRDQAKSTEDKELAEVLAIIKEAEHDYQTGNTRTITSAEQLDDL
ncbi:hypothetical protein HY523_00240 [Candidatus Berkelbacteria bacterium]|nr:hypothetical protein [Candidatus Berkelbacteria bacterium]